VVLVEKQRNLEGSKRQLSALRKPAREHKTAANESSIRSLDMPHQPSNISEALTQAISQLEPIFDAPRLTAWCQAFACFLSGEDATEKLGALLENEQAPYPELIQFTLARAFLQQGHAERALPLLNELLQQRPQQLTIHLEYGLGLIFCERFEEAAEHLEASIQRFALLPERALLIADLCTVYHRLGEWEKGEACCTPTADSSPQARCSLLSNRAAFRIALGRHDEAEADLREALSSAPEHAAAWANLAYLRQSQGRWAEAQAALQHEPSQLELLLGSVPMRERAR
jgi:tetratricopeptide (TPR) repeat protein